LPAALATLAILGASASASADCQAADPREGSRVHRLELPSTGRERRTVFPGKKPRVAVLAFWAHWCKPCFEELPAYDRLIRRFGGDVELVLISIDDDPDDVRTALQKMGLAHSSAYAGNRALASYRQGSVPFTLVVDRRAVIRRVHRGFDKACLPSLARDIRALL